MHSIWLRNCPRRKLRLLNNRGAYHRYLSRNSGVRNGYDEKYWRPDWRSHPRKRQGAGTGALFRSPRSGLKAITLADALLSGTFTARQHGAHG